MNTTYPKIYISRNCVFYEGQKLQNYDLHGGFIDCVVLEKILVKRKKNDKKQYYLVAHIKDHTKRGYTINIDVLEKYYKTY